MPAHLPMPIMPTKWLVKSECYAKYIWRVTSHFTCLQVHPNQVVMVVSSPYKVTSLSRRESCFAPQYLPVCPHDMHVTCQCDSLQLEFLQYQKQCSQQQKLLQRQCNARKLWRSKKLGNSAQCLCQIFVSSDIFSN